MRTSLLSIAAVASLIISVAPASAVDITIGNSLASACYRSSMASITPRFALIECNRSIEEELLNDADRAATFVNRGIVRMKAGDYRGADSDFDRALLLDRRRAEANLNKGFLRLRLGQFRDALPFLDRSIEGRTIRPALAYYARAVAHEELGDVQSAYSDLLKARAADPAWSIPVQELARYKVGR
ncbi:MAG TPA: hypothetical protein VFK50_08735 [Sphingomicrobium sp.]|nr:hypothetical protein [Sphingomicrobium sp.]